MSENHPTDHKSITAPNFPEEGCREADSEFAESEKDYKRVEAEFSRVYELSKQQDCMHNVWCLDPVNIERTSLRGFRTIRQFTALPSIFFSCPFGYETLSWNLKGSSRYQL